MPEWKDLFFIIYMAKKLIKKRSQPVANSPTI